METLECKLAELIRETQNPNKQVYCMKCGFNGWVGQQCKCLYEFFHYRDVLEALYNDMKTPF